MSAHAFTHWPGADVGHPGPNQFRPSIATVVYSRDKDALQYEAITTAQRPRLENIENLREKTSHAIRRFLINNNTEAAAGGGPAAVKNIPSNIVFLRDGLSEGQYEAFARQEIQDIENGIAQAWETVKLPRAQDTPPKASAETVKLPRAQDTPPKASAETLRSRSVPLPSLTYVVVSKRHHVRFFATDERQTCTNGNLHAGFVTTGGIDSPYSYDFYMQSQHAIQGTARPAHYIILQDKILDDEALQTGHAARLNHIARLSFYLCHAYSKATSSVSIPAPVYYADIACRRGDIHLDRALRYGEDTSSEGSAGTLSNAVIEQKIAIWCSNFKRVFDGHSPMYFI
ncbi:ribonuclease H-like domain-containing protein [Schizophyllum fasciatum]